MSASTIKRHAAALTRAYAAYQTARARHDEAAAALSPFEAKKRLNKKQRAEREALQDAINAARDEMAAQTVAMRHAAAKLWQAGYVVVDGAPVRVAQEAGAA